MRRNMTTLTVRQSFFVIVIAALLCAWHLEQREVEKLRAENESLKAWSRFDENEFNTAVYRRARELLAAQGSPALNSAGAP